MLKVKLFTHTDLDGVGCAILAKKHFENCDIEFCDYDNVNQKIEHFIQNDDYAKYNRVYITDISINEAISQLVDCIKYEIYFKLIDHHTTALWLNNYEWANVSEINSSGDMTSGTELFYNYLIKENTRVLSLKNVVVDITLYDSWRWINDYSHPYIPSKKLNRLLSLLGRDVFIQEILNKKYIDDFKMILDVEDKKIDSLVRLKNTQLKKSSIVDINDKTRCFGYVFSENNVSEIGDYILRNNNELDFVAIINISNKIVSLRGLSDRNIHLGADIAKMYYGGGHKDSAGCKLIGRFADVLLEELED